LIRKIRGHGGAWNHGTELAIGKYLFYLDSDDWFDTDEFSKLITFLNTCDTDVVMLDKQNFRADTNQYEKLTYRDGLIDPGKVYNFNEYDWIGCGVGWKMTYVYFLPKNWCNYDDALKSELLELSTIIRDGINNKTR